MGESLARCARRLRAVLGGCFVLPQYALLIYNFHSDVVEREAE